jgi:S-adenosylmethionine synthetase
MRIYTSESVSEGHPDKLADQISDALLDAFLDQDQNLKAAGKWPEHYLGARVAIETLLTRGVAVVAGEVTSEGYVDIPHVVRDTIINAGYTDTDLGFDGNTCGVLVAIQEQSPDIGQGVDIGGAGDQGMMFGYATRETPELMPLTLSIAHALTRQAADVRRRHPGLGLRPDMKSQVSVEYGPDGRPDRINTIVVSQQHSEEVGKGIQETVRTRIIEPVLKGYQEYVKGDITFHINPTGKFVIGGPQGDTGVTGRKIIVDTYGGMAPHGGGAFSGKDPTKVDRSATYMARKVAKCVVAAGLADRAVVQIAYAIGVAEPVAVNVETFGTEKIDVEEIEKRIRANFDLTPKGIIENLGLLEGKVKYVETAKNGHFGNANFPWESTENASALK